MTCVLFLDFDGVISSHRAHVARREWIDPIACEMIAKLQEKFGFKIVVSSSWRGMEQRCRDALSPSKLIEHLHDDWRTNNSPTGFRGEEVEDWLNRNGRPEYIIFDDDSDFNEEQSCRLVLTDGLNGFLMQHFQAAEKLLTRICGEANGRGA